GSIQRRFFREHTKADCEDFLTRFSASASTWKTTKPYHAKGYENHFADFVASRRWDGRLFPPKNSTIGKFFFT
ncbi:MAG TPA: hypothetical protein DDZ51_05850, partial [Planctomycetaceae bacterium]|nr:hypothetical protein [Planctomycetaceae bacterium]